MTPKEALALLATAAKAWPWIAPDEQQGRVWISSLAGMDAELGRRALDHCVARDETPPTIARLNDVVRAIKRAEQPSFVALPKPPPTVDEIEFRQSEIERARGLIAKAKSEAALRRNPGGNAI